jgi:FkbM family methyltransferase
MIEDLLGVPENAIRIADIGAAFLGQRPPYQPLLDRGLGQLIAFEPDARQHESLRRHAGASAQIFPVALGDGARKTLFVCGDDTGMSSVFEPDEKALGFFNLFPAFGKVERRIEIDTARLDDLDAVPDIDFLKMDVQGSELSILQNGHKKLARCVFVQTEISFVALYKNQPTFGEVDGELRGLGMVPHCFTEVKRWSIFPTVRDNNPKLPFNQLLEGDIVYMKSMIDPQMSDLEIKKAAVIAHYCYKSTDLAIRCIMTLQDRGTVPGDAVARYIRSM